MVVVVVVEWEMGGLFVVKDVLRENIGNLCKGRLLAGEPLLSTPLVPNAVSLLSYLEFLRLPYYFTLQDKCAL